MNIRAGSLLLILFLKLGAISHSQETQSIIKFLSGTDKDHTVNWDFYCTKGSRSGTWTNIPVPSQWELQGFGNYNYGHDKIKTDEQGLYKYSFEVSKGWANKKVFLVFEGVMTDAAIKINGVSAGPIHQGGFTQFSYDVTDLIKLGAANILEVTVSKQSADKSIERAERGGDFWTFGGIYRPVYLKAVPNVYIERVAINADHKGKFKIDLFTKNTKRSQVAEVQVKDLKGRLIGNVSKTITSDSIELSKDFMGIKPWNAEDPQLYSATISIKENGKLIHQINQRFGFRTAELRLHDGFYVNDVKVILKGVNRHSFWPASGRTLSRAIHLQDIGLMKDMNMNAVRMSHYPPDVEFLDLCDSLGLFVIDELTGWQHAYDTIPGHKIAKEMIVRDVNHPSIVIWSDGDEGGWNRDVDNDFKVYDPQRRLLIHPWEKFNGTDSRHYPDYNYVVNTLLYGTEVFITTEFMHGLYDGGHAAGLSDFWEAMLTYPHLAGGFLWVLSDEGVVRVDKDSILDNDGNHAPDGIVGPYREKEGSYNAIKEIWSPVKIHTKELPVDFDGNLKIENRYLYTNLSACKFSWKLVNFSNPNIDKASLLTVDSGAANTLSLAPGATGYLKLNLKGKTADALYLTAVDKMGKNIFTWSWAIKDPAAIAKNKVTVTSNELKIDNEDGKSVTVSSNGIKYLFNKESGYLDKVFKGAKEISFGAGPVLAGSEQKLTAFAAYKDGEKIIVEPSYKGADMFKVKWIFTKDQLPALEYSYTVNLNHNYTMQGMQDYMGITFNYPEEKITGMKWLGRGPFRVWKNRMEGQELGVWQKKYNNTITGESWNYPEFKGWHSNLYWVTLQNKESNFTVYTDKRNVFLQMLQPQKAKSAPNDYTNPAFPGNTIGFMNAISPIGTKFQEAAVMGPQSLKNTQLNYSPVQGNLWFDFR